MLLDGHASFIDHTPIPRNPTRTGWPPNPQVGVLSIIFIRMIINDCPPFFIVYAVLAIPTGLSLSVLQPRHIVGEDLTDAVGGPSDPQWLTVFRYLDSPFWAPIWALLGDFDVQTLIEDSRGQVFVEWLLPVL